MLKRIAGYGVVAAAMATAAALAPVAYGAETIKITFISGYPPVSPWVGAFNDRFVPEVDAALAKSGKYKIDWNLAHSGQVVKPRGELEGVQSGLGEMTVVTMGFYADKLPLYTLPFVTPFTTSDPGLLADNFVALQNKFPEFAKDWDKYGHVQIGTSTNIDNYVIISKAPIKTLADLKGKKIGGAGPNLIWVTPVGATGVSTTLTDAYTSLNTGVYDAVIMWKQAMGTFKLCEPAPYVFDTGFGSAGMLVLSVNRDVWKSLPDEVSKAMSAAAVGWNKTQISMLVGGAEEQLEMCKAKYNTKVTELSPAERASWAKGMAPLALDWAKATAAKGYPANEILTAYMDYMRAHKQPVLRNWDKE